VIPRFVAITPGDGRDLGPWLDALGGAGVPGLILREPSGPLSTWLDRARRAGFAWVATHDRHPDARHLPADAVHLPDDGRPPPTDRPWGRACHSPAAAREALGAGASYALLSPIWSPGSKPTDVRPPLGPDALAAAGPGPVLALGGVTPNRLAALCARGAYGGAAIGACFDHPNPETAARAAAAWIRVLHRTPG
jgi:thiamine-phosphate pyrophosphorylase